MGNSSVARLWGYTLAEGVPKTRQRLDLPRRCSLSDPTRTAAAITVQRNCCLYCAHATVDAGTTQNLRNACLSRGISVESVVLASLFLAAAKAAKVSPQVVRATPPGSPSPSNRGLSHSEHNGAVGSIANLNVSSTSSTSSTSTRIQRASVLGIVSLVMALLSGSVDSKALRYFCSLYAVFAGAWAVNVITVDPPGFMFLVVTSVAAKVIHGSTAAAFAGSTRGHAFTPVRLAVDCQRGGLWDIAERHGRGSRGVALSENSFSRFKRQSLGVRGAGYRCRRWWRGRLGLKTAGTAVAGASSPVLQEGDELLTPPFQLFGCIQVDRGVASTAAASPPSVVDVKGEEAEARAVFGADGGSATGDERACGGCLVGGDRDGEGVAGLLPVLDARYTLICRNVSAGRTLSSGRRSAGGDVVRAEGSGDCVPSTSGGESSEGGDGGCGGGDRCYVPDHKQIAPEGLDPAGIELTLVEDSGKKCAVKGRGSGVDVGYPSMTKWLLEHAMAVLIDECQSKTQGYDKQ